MISTTLQDYLDKYVDNDKSIFNAVLSILTGNGEISWSGASGIANETKQILMTPKTPFFIASITKLFTATIIMRFFEEKKINLDDKIVDRLPETLVKGIHIYKGLDYTDSITIKHLLSHTSGIADYYLEKPKRGKSFFDIILENPEKTYTADQTIAIARDTLRANFEPGKKAKYSDTNFQLLGKIIESVAGKELHNVYYDYLFSPLSLNTTWLFKKSDPIERISIPVAEFYYKDKIISNNRPFESSWADGGLISTTDDCLNFLQALLTGKIFNQETTLPLMHQWNGIGFPLKYGFGTMNIELPSSMTMGKKIPPLIGHIGSTGSFLLYAKDLDIYFAGTINQASSQSKSVKFLAKLLIMMKRYISN